MRDIVIKDLVENLECMKRFSSKQSCIPKSSNPDEYKSQLEQVDDLDLLEAYIDLHE